MSLHAAHICLVIPTLEAGGAERVMAELAQYLHLQHKGKLSMVLLLKAKRFFQVPEGIEVIEPDFDYRRFSRPVYSYKIFRYARQAFRHLQPDVVLSFGGRYNSFVALAATGLVPKIWVSERSKPSKSHGKLIEMINRAVYPRVTGMIVQTRCAQEIFSKKYHLKRVVVIPNPFQKAKRLTNGKHIVLNVGRFIKTKNQAQLLQIWAGLKQRGWQLVLVGDGPEYQNCVQLAHDLGIVDSVTFTGAQKDVDKYYQGASVFAFTSSSEGFPNALGEAMMHGLVPISYNIEAGPADLIDDGLNGFLVEPYSHEMFGNKLQQVLQNPNLRQEMSEAAHQKMKQFEIEFIGRKFQETLCS